MWLPVTTRLHTCWVRPFMFCVAFPPPPPPPLPWPALFHVLYFTSVASGSLQQLDLSTAPLLTQNTVFSAKEYKSCPFRQVLVFDCAVCHYITFVCLSPLQASRSSLFYPADDQCTDQLTENSCLTGHINGLILYLLSRLVHIIPLNGILLDVFSCFSRWNESRLSTQTPQIRCKHCLSASDVID